MFLFGQSPTATFRFSPFLPSTFLSTSQPVLSLSLALAILAKRTRILSYIIHDTMCFNDETFAVDSNRCRANRALFRSLLSRPSGGRGEGEWFARALLLIGVYHRFARHARRNLSLPYTGTRPAKFKNFKPRKV